MHDLSLGAPVDVGEYTGPKLDGQPLHKGNCEDGVYGCRKCGERVRTLSDEQLLSIGADLTTSCESCGKEVSVRDIRGYKAWDEPVYYEACLACYKKYLKSIPEPEEDWGDFDDE